MSDNEISVIDRRKFSNALDLSHGKFVLSPEADPEKSTLAEWKEKVSSVLSYGPPEPILSRVLVRQHGKEHHTSKKLGAGFWIPDSYKQNPGVGVVVAVGPDIKPEQLKIGDVVKFGLFSAEEVKYDEEVFQLINFEDIKYIERVMFTLYQEEAEEPDQEAA